MDRVVCICRTGKQTRDLKRVVCVGEGIVENVYTEKEWEGKVYSVWLCVCGKGRKGR